MDNFVIIFYIRAVNEDDSEFEQNSWEQSVDLNLGLEWYSQVFTSPEIVKQLFILPIRAV